MEPATPAKEDFLKSRFYKGTTILIAIVVTIGVCFTIASHWRTYDWISKFLGIVLVFNLLVGPLPVIKRMRKGETARPEMLLQTAYIWLLLATLLFTR
jgi:hypothetical protein